MHVAMMAVTSVWPLGNYLVYERDMCIKGLFWPPLEPKIESCFSPISSYGLLEE